MKIVNSHTMEEEYTESPKGKFAGGWKGISLALGREERSTDLLKRHPFDVEIQRIPPGKACCPFHSHSAQWEFYHVISGRGQIRHAEGLADIGPGDAFIFKPGEPHQTLNNGTEDLVLYCVADNPIGESCHYPDSGKWLVQSPKRHILRSEDIDYFDGEE